ncbi:hypothetical protein C8Q74DRAFT_370837 [Fomes fomentarius]|nr:hypothetical protein C8Q74DRAFT_370837 [Fomes fomentarius]
MLLRALRLQYNSPVCYSVVLSTAGGLLSHRWTCARVFYTASTAHFRGNSSSPANVDTQTFGARRERYRRC